MKKILLYGLLIALGDRLLAENEPVESKPKFIWWRWYLPQEVLLENRDMREYTMSQVALYLNGLLAAATALPF